MAFVRISPLEVRVRCDWLSGTPRAVELGDETVPVLSIARVRQETAAHPVSVGPRTRFDVVTASTRLSLAYEHRSRRWLVDGMDARVEDVALAA